MVFFCFFHFCWSVNMKTVNMRSWMQKWTIWEQCLVIFIDTILRYSHIGIYVKMSASYVERWSINRVQLATSRQSWHDTNCGRCNLSIIDVLNEINHVPDAKHYDCMTQALQAWHFLIFLWYGCHDMICIVYIRMQQVDSVIWYV